VWDSTSIRGTSVEINKKSSRVQERDEMRNSQYKRRQTDRQHTSTARVETETEKGTNERKEPKKRKSNNEENTSKDVLAVGEGVVQGLIGVLGLGGREPHRTAGDYSKGDHVGDRFHNVPGQLPPGEACHSRTLQQQTERTQAHETIRRPVRTPIDVTVDRVQLDQFLEREREETERNRNKEREETERETEREKNR
jgi:hypothetical protein